MVPLLVKHGTVVTSSGRRTADIAADGGIVVAMGSDLDVDADRTIDAGGKLVFPGFIDPHTHMELPVAGTMSSDDFYTGTRAAAAGGVTTIIDFCSQVPGQSFGEVLTLWKSKARKSVIDYGFHIIVPQLEPRQIDEMPDLVAEGVTTVKCMMAYKRGPQGSDDANLLRVIRKARECGALPMVHAENGDAVDVQTDALLAEGKTSPRYHPLSRPSMVEAEAVNRAAMLAALADYCVYIVHLSSAQALEALRLANSRGWAAYAETCPQYLTLDDSRYDIEGFEAAKYVCSPPLRPKEDQHVLWGGLMDGTLRLVASDHCPFFFHGQKDRGRDNFALIPNGIPTIEAMFPLLFSEGVNRGRIGLERFVELSSSNAAKMFGLYPQKGEIAVGSDADLVVFDPAQRVTLSTEVLHSRVDYTPYDGFEVKGYPIYTISRGEIVFERGTLTERAQEGRGRYLRRRPWTGDPLS